MEMEKSQDLYLLHTTCVICDQPLIDQGYSAPEMWLHATEQDHKAVPKPIGSGPKMNRKFSKTP